MKAEQLAIPGLILLHPTIYNDDRGFFYESFNQNTFEQMTGLSPHFVQDNHSRSHYGVLRGLHYQMTPHAQDKLIRVVRGSIFDVAVDIRTTSPYFGQWIGVELSAENHQQLWIPKGFAHGFLVLSDVADVLYKTSDYYAVNSERCIHWSDQSIGIDWPLSKNEISVSPKDDQGVAFRTITDNSF